MSEDLGYEEDVYPPSILSTVKETLLTPLHIALSPALLRTYLRTLLLLTTSTLLFIAAIIAYSTFYYTYIPIRGIKVPVYLQFDLSHNVGSSYGSYAGSYAGGLGTGNKGTAYGIEELKGLVGSQKYDVEVEMVVPRSERNLGAGNWMVGVDVRGPSSNSGGQYEWEEDHSPPFGTGESDDADKMKQKAENRPDILARSSRPALLTYRSWMTESVYRLLRLPLYALGFTQESETITIGMMEGVAFGKSGTRNVPSSIRLDIRSSTPLEIYKVAVRFDAKLEGLRWVMYKHWIASAVVFTGLFWSVEMGVVLLTWGFFTMVFSGGTQVKEEEDEGYESETNDVKIRQHGSHAAQDPQDNLKTEDGQMTPLSDTSRTFPGYGAQRALHFSSSSDAREQSSRKFKQERGATPRLEDIPIATGMEADDEDEDADFILEGRAPGSGPHGLTDSGIGTSLESSGAREGLGVRRRSSGKKKRGG